MLKRITALGLALLLLASLCACKPDNIQYPTVITDPMAEPQPEVQEPPKTEVPQATAPSTPVVIPGETPAVTPGETPSATPDATVDQTPSATPDATVDQTPSATPDTPAETPAPPAQTPAVPPAQTPAAPPADSVETVTTPEPQPQPENDKTQDIVSNVPQQNNPLCSADYKPATDAKGALTPSNFIKNGSAAAALKNRTITFYTADETAAFTYKDGKGNPVSEWDWAKEMAENYGFQLKYTVKNKNISLKAQRTALFAGRKLNLIQMTDDFLALGMSLSRSAAEYLNEAVTPFGISKAVLNQSNKTLFAPVGMANTLWYDTALMPEATDPATLSAQNAWTVEQYKAIVQNSVNQKMMPLEMSLTADWMLLSGRSPLTLLNGKLDSNIYAQVTQQAFATLKTVNSALPAFVKDEDATYSFENANLAMAYTAAVPVTHDGVKPGYTALPALQAGQASPVSFAGTFFALPKYQKDEGNDQAALTFAELWCNRYTEARAADLYQVGIKAAEYDAYGKFTETKGQLIFRDPEIDTWCEPYLKGLADPTINTDDAYGTIKPQLMAKIAAYNLYY